MEKRHYFDWAATAIPEHTVKGSGIPFGNPSSQHAEGIKAREALENARSRCAAVLGVPSDTLYFTSGGTEANCIPLYSHLARKCGGRILASAGEHSSVAENIRVLERAGKITGFIPIDNQGRVTPDSLKKTLDKFTDVRFAAIMAVNNETGTINDIAALGELLKNQSPPVHLHCDMVQAAGKIAINPVKMNVDSASVSAHKIGGPRGIGLLYLRKPFEVLYCGGGQEKNIRPGTENVAGALALAACLENHAQIDEHACTRWTKLICALKNMERCRLIPQERDSESEGFSPYILQAAFHDIPGEVLIRALDDLGFAVSTGSACSSNAPERPVLAAMGINEKTRLEGIRISQGWSTTEEEIELLIDALKEVLKFL